LDTKAEISPLNNDERRIMRSANDELAKLRRDEETKWAQRARVKHIQEEGNNTKIFPSNYKWQAQKEEKFQPEKQEGAIVGQNSLKTYIFEYYKSLFGDPTPNHFGMLESEK
jgi:hypothetical protein